MSRDTTDYDGTASSTSNLSQTEHKHENEEDDDDFRPSLTATPSKNSLDINNNENNTGGSNNKILGVAYGIGMNVNNVLGSGIVTSPGIIWKAVKSPKIVLLLWIIGGIVAMSGSLSYVELGFYHRISGGETKYLQSAYRTPRDM